MSDCQFRYAALGSGCASTSVFALPQHPDEDRPEPPILLAVEGRWIGLALALFALAVVGLGAWMLVSG